MYIYIYIYIYILLSVTDKGPPMVHPSICLQNTLLKVKVTSVASFIIPLKDKSRTYLW